MSDFIPWDEFGAIMKLRSQERHERMRVANEKLAKHADIQVVSRFTDDHWRIQVGGALYDFWPSTGRYRSFPTHKGATGKGGLRSILRKSKSSEGRSAQPHD